MLFFCSEARSLSSLKKAHIEVSAAVQSEKRDTPEYDYEASVSFCCRLESISQCSIRTIVGYVVALLGCSMPTLQHPATQNVLLTLCPIIHRQPTTKSHRTLKAMGHVDESLGVVSCIAVQSHGNRLSKLLHVYEPCASNAQLRISLHLRLLHDCGVHTAVVHESAALVYDDEIVS